MLMKHKLTPPGLKMSSSRYVPYYHGMSYGLEYEMKFRSEKEAYSLYSLLIGNFSKLNIYNLEWDRDVAGLHVNWDSDARCRYTLDENNQYLRGFEIVTRPFRSFEGVLNFYYSIKEYLYKAKACPQITSCHIHFDAYWMDDAFMVSLYRRLHKIQHLVYNYLQGTPDYVTNREMIMYEIGGHTPPAAFQKRVISAYQKNFEKVYREHRLQHAVKMLPEYTGSTDPSDGDFFYWLFGGKPVDKISKYEFMRYHWVNFTAPFIYGTFEVRLPESIEQALWMIKFMEKEFMRVSACLKMNPMLDKDRLTDSKNGYTHLCEANKCDADDSESASV